MIVRRISTELYLSLAMEFSVVATINLPPPSLEPNMARVGLVSSRVNSFNIFDIFFKPPSDSMITILTPSLEKLESSPPLVFSLTISASSCSIRFLWSFHSVKNRSAVRGTSLTFTPNTSPVCRSNPSCSRA